MAVDRENRNRLVCEIDRYLHEETTAFEFNDAIFEIRGRTSDQTIQNAVEFLWLFYDDCEDHHVLADRTTWNCIQRIRFLLKSDAELTCHNKRIWSATQLVGLLLYPFWLLYAPLVLIYQLFPVCFDIRQVVAKQASR